MQMSFTTGIRCFVAFAISGFALIPVAGAQPDSPATDLDAIKEQAQAETIPIVIFLPGILGSELRLGAKSLWGDDGIINSLDEDIAYDEKRKVDASVLERFSV